MQRYFERQLFAAAMMAFALAITSPARAEMTEADEAGKRAFAACLDETGNDEDVCLDKLGRYAWYPRDNAACEAVAVRVRAALSEEGQAEWRDLFFNERCAHLGLSHDKEAAIAGDNLNPANTYTLCLMEGGRNCTEELGRHAKVPYRPDLDVCASLVAIYKNHAVKKKLQTSWSFLFSIERCSRLGLTHF